MPPAVPAASFPSSSSSPGELPPHHSHHLQAERAGGTSRHLSRDALLASLAAEISAHERRAGLARPWPDAGGPASAALPMEGRWSFGSPEIDAHLVGGLDPCGVHEIKPALPAPGRAGAGARAAALTLALGLAVRRLQTLHPAADPAPPVLLCATDAAIADIGRPYGPGLVSLGLDPGRLVLVEARRATDALAAVEEGLRSSAVALVLALLDAVETTPARRLSLAAETGATPCLLLTAGSAPGAMSAVTRWRVAPAPAAPHPFDPAAPGNARHAVHLERCRLGAVRGSLPPLTLEWCHETHRFRVAALVAHRAETPPCPRLRAG